MIERQFEPELTEPFHVMDIYADAIADVDDLGENFRTIYVIHTKPPGSHIYQRQVVAKIVRAKRSLLSTEGGLTRWLARKHAAEVERLNS